MQWSNLTSMFSDGLKVKATHYWLYGLYIHKCEYTYIFVIHIRRSTVFWPLRNPQTIFSFHNNFTHKFPGLPFQSPEAFRPCFGFSCERCGIAAPWWKLLVAHGKTRNTDGWVLRQANGTFSGKVGIYSTSTIFVTKLDTDIQGVFLMCSSLKCMYTYIINIQEKTHKFDVQGIPG